MRGRPFEMAWQESDTPETLKGAYQKERGPEVRIRLHGLWLLRCGWSLCRVAEALGIHYRSVQRWVAWYRQGGLPEVKRHKMGSRGRPPLLRPEQENQVRDAVAAGQFRTAWEIRDWIARQYKTNYTLGGVYSLLKRLKCASKVSHPVHAKPDRQVQRGKKVYATLEDKIKGVDALPHLVGLDRGRRPAISHQLCDMMKEVPHHN